MSVPEDALEISPAGAPAGRAAAIGLGTSSAMRSADYAALLLIGACYLLYGIDAYGLLNNNEGLYAEIARETLAQGFSAVPTLNGVPYLEKPPLLSWLLAGVFALFGQSELAARSIPVAADVILIAAVVGLTRIKAPAMVSWLAGLILATSLPHAVIFRTLVPDALLTALFGLTMLFFLQWHRRRDNLRLVLSYACLGLAIMAKGFLAMVLGLAVFVVFAAIAKRAWRLRDLLYPPAVLALLIIAAPWHLALVAGNPDFGWFYIVNEHVLRFLDLREPKDYYTGPLYYYLPRILMYLFPWSAFVPLLIRRRPRGLAAMSDLEKLAWVWFGVSLVFFSVSRAKGNYYMILGMPPLAILLALRIAELLEQGRRRVLLPGIALLLALVAAALWSLRAGIWMSEPHGLWIAAFKLVEDMKLSLLGFAAMIALAAALLMARRERSALYAVALSSVPLLLFFVTMMTRADPYVSERRIGEYVRANLGDRAVFLFQDYEKLASLPFYLERQVPVVATRSNDLRFGMEHSPDRTNFVSVAQFDAIRSTRAVVLLVHRHRLAAYRELLGNSGLVRRAQVGSVSVFVN